ncbi:hypothetical protein K2173_026454 [Erythroxylum novogranatense]|uniref:Uncharacterized protein n=1 Tax=Erythroxylum novogranatense TaxID=1862640 RepID=A0AAV8TW58_9ROSI|nr:hypothetical protein K2173_026454 [Erythroxylum novogranatense]
MATSFSHFSSKISVAAFFIFYSSLATSISTKTSPEAIPFKKIYAFGDSFTDTGNTKSLSGPGGFGHVSNSPYGITFFHHSTNRYSDGRLVIDFVAESLSLPFLPPYRYMKGNGANGVNFAVAGSTAISHSFFVKNNLTLNITPESIQTQLLWFNKFMERQGCIGSASSSPACKAAFDGALFWVGEMGVNDYAYTIGSTVPNETIQKLVISSLTGFLEEILNKGARHVVVQGLPPSGCLPLALVLTSEDDRDNIGCAKSVNSQTQNHNMIYQTKLQDLRRQFPEAVITYLDYWTAYHTVMENPARYGFEERLKACCGSGGPPYNFQVFATCGTPSASVCQNPSQYINWDGVHLTEAMYKELADMFVNGTFSHPPFSELLGKKLRGD